jgi:hypothetical protein
MVVNEMSGSIGKSMHWFLVAKQVIFFPYRVMSTLKPPLRIKVFLCLLVIRNRILTKENSMKKGWRKVERCEFCDDREIGATMAMVRGATTSCLVRSYT